MAAVCAASSAARRASMRWSSVIGLVLGAVGELGAEAFGLGACVRRDPREIACPSHLAGPLDPRDLPPQVRPPFRQGQDRLAEVRARASSLLGHGCDPPPQRPPMPVAQASPPSRTTPP